MPKDNREFFKKKKIWSKVKDDLLGCYLTPYFTKMLSSGRPILYVDCFAGKGKFDDGNDGSPLTALKCLENSISSSSNRNRPPVKMKFIELNHAADLRANLAGAPTDLWDVVEGKFEDKIISLLKGASNNPGQLNVFLYIDPYGVKVLNTPLFDELPNMFGSVELLINFNSFGFIREACRVMKIAIREDESEIFDGIEEYDDSVSDSIEELNAVAGDDQWQSIISNYQQQGKINCYEAEQEFSRQYKERLRQSYKYVLDMPIRLKPGQHPKYRMVHATNHPDGCILMADNVAKRTELVIRIQSGGQLGLWQQTADNVIVSEELLMGKVRELLESTTDLIRLNKFLADFYNRYGVLCELSRLSSGPGSILKTLEKNGSIEVKRKPDVSPTGKPTTFWQEKKDHTISLRKRS